MDEYKYIYDKYDVEIVSPTGSGGAPFGQLLKSVVESEDIPLLNKISHFSDALPDYYTLPYPLRLQNVKLNSDGSFSYPYRIELS